MCIRDRRIIKIHTTATDKDGNKELEAGKDVTIIDTVTLEGLEIGTQYKLVGWQMLKEENAELLINGKRVESDYTFTADSETMKVEVAFTFDATSLDGKQLAVSYTHLDVYKRQLHRCSVRRSGRSWRRGAAAKGYDPRGRR